LDVARGEYKCNQINQSVTSTHVQDIDEEAYYFVHAFLDFMN
jgi:hypothetical protein